MVSNDPYAQVAKGKLKLKGDSGIKKKKKNKKEKVLEQVSKTLDIPEQNEQLKSELKKTKAEMAYLKMKEKMQTERIMEKASLTHKQRVEKFNQHLDSLTEHFDIPKVSWTK
ncbi:protein FAM32A-like [Agrilus planipennis]|uniref:Protein FAM32A n=1 Tax=Agrilus planipennis TaxID=224129 RepID=A0A1W4XLP1_AGRPL|nr:protein FAM32A [Agrilus planipennis]XP_025832667.1 protein FAM32A-like [Agrilus planipennis]